jgi:hypothetical protein
VSITTQGYLSSKLNSFWLFHCCTRTLKHSNELSRGAASANHKALGKRNFPSQGPTRHGPQDRHLFCISTLTSRGCESQVATTISNNHLHPHPPSPCLPECPYSQCKPSSFSAQRTAPESWPNTTPLPTAAPQVSWLLPGGRNLKLRKPAGID